MASAPKKEIADVPATDVDIDLLDEDQLRELIQKGVDYYQQIASPAVAHRFVDACQLACQQVAMQPGLGSLRYQHLLAGGGLRCWSLGNFPY